VSSRAGAHAPSTAGKRLESLTGLRWFAAFGVFCFHLGYLVADRPKLRAAAELGYKGVPFFFVLSGFVLAWVYRPGDSPLRFYWHRFARIWPAMAAVALVALALQYRWTGTQPPPVDIAFAFSLLQAWSPEHMYAVNVVAWTLSAEAFFYLLFPLLVRGLIRLRPPALLAVSAAMLCLSTGTSVAVSEYTFSKHNVILIIASPPSLTPLFVIGICTALAVRQGWRPRVGARLSLALVAASLVFCWAWILHPTMLPFIKIGGLSDVVVIPSFALAMAALAVRDSDGGRSWLARPAVVFLGTISFAFYLVHVVLLDLYRHYRFLAPSSSTFTQEMTLSLIGALVVTIAAAWALHGLVERPVERFLRNLLPKQPPRAMPEIPEPRPAPAGSPQALTV
jgi:peptidoglycan/LPS O-acetylase OafA/YrhL